MVYDRQNYSGLLVVCNGHQFSARKVNDGIWQQWTDGGLVCLRRYSDRRQLEIIVDRKRFRQAQQVQWEKVAGNGMAGKC